MNGTVVVRLLFICFFSCFVAGAAQSPADHPDISGYWVLKYDSMNVPFASLTPQAAAADKDKQLEHDQLAIRWCDQLGTPAMMNDREPLDIEQSPKEIAIVAHAPSSVRYIYTDGRSHPKEEEFDPTTNGNSIGTWEGRTLVVDTVYFNDRGVTMLPGGGIRTANSHLVERYTMSDDGERLFVTFTWTAQSIRQTSHLFVHVPQDEIGRRASHRLLQRRRRVESKFSAAAFSKRGRAAAIARRESKWEEQVITARHLASRAPVIIVVSACLSLCSSLGAQDSSEHPDLTGMWLVQDPGSGSFGDFMNNVPAPELRPEIIKQNEEAAARAQQTVFHNLNDHTNCAEGGDIVLMMASSPAMSILQSKDETLIAADANRSRFIYTDGRSHKDIHSPNYHATGFGDSIGHWEGDTFVVDTIGFPNRMCGGRTPYIETPRGGRALPSTHLTERFHVNADHTMLTITFTWEDPAVFLKPHTYAYNYKFLPGALPFENEDSQRDAEYQQRLRTSVVAPKQ